MDNKYNNFYQYSTISALMAKDFYGSITFKQLLTKGDLGIGTFHGVDGELIVFDGKAYQMLNSGQVNVVSEEMTSPFATLTFFKSSVVIEYENISYSDFEQLLLKIFPSMNLFYAYKVVGEFKQVMIRTVVKQEEPFSSLLIATKNQNINTLNKISGNVVGFWTPNFANTIGVSGFHSHFISQDKTQGGHVFNFQAQKLKVELSYLNNMELQLPISKSYLEYELSDIDLQDSIIKAESQRK